MSWYSVLVPAAAIAYLVRLYAIFIGPYYSWLEIVPYLHGEDEHSHKKRRTAFRRRVIMPFVVMLALALAFPGTYDSNAGALVGALAAGLLLWPVLITESVHVHGGTLLTAGLYLLMFAAFGLSGWLGAYVAAWIIEEQGGLFAFARTQLLAWVVGGAVLWVLSDGMTAIGTRAARDLHSSE